MLRSLIVRIASLLIMLAMLASAISAPAPALAAPASGLTPPTGLLWSFQHPETHAYADHMGPRDIASGPYGTFLRPMGVAISTFTRKMR